MLARRASYDKKTLARQVIPLAPGYRTALSSRPDNMSQPLENSRQWLVALLSFGGACKILLN